ncbi:MAG TPA: polyprenyl synthetase family protein [Polyangiaceae bacterium]|nr:polyprenyl synthetase family protein [Polyangiaceae bacterium]
MATSFDPTTAIEHLSSISRRNPGAKHATPRLDDVTRLVHGELASVELWLKDAMARESSCSIAASDLIRAGGKRMRPSIVLLATRLVCGADIRSDQVLGFAAAVEMLHTATLLHDDVIDEAPLRRGKPTARMLWGNPVSVIGGDLLMVRALNVINALGKPFLDRMTVQTLQELVMGEVEQLERRGKLEMDIDTFERIAHRKTASLFVLGAVGGAFLAGASQPILDHLRQFACAAGLAFQLDDDLLDLCSTPEAIGKAVGQDLSTGSVTLPVSDVLNRDPALRIAISDHRSATPQEPLPPWICHRLLEIAHQPGVLDRCRNLVRSYGNRSLDALLELQPSTERRALETLVELLVWRSAGQHDGQDCKRELP